MVDPVLGQTIRAARKRRGLTIMHLAYQARVSVRTLELLEVHGLVPGASLLARLTSALGLNAEPPAAAPPPPPVRDRGRRKTA